MDPRKRLTTQFAETVKVLNIDDAIGINLIAAINEEELKRGNFHIDESYLQLQELKQQAAKEQERYFSELSTYQDEHSKLTDEIDILDTQINQLRQKGKVKQLIKIGEKTELQLERINDTENLKYDAEAENWFRKYVFCCCGSSPKIKDDTKKIALLDKKISDSEASKSHPILDEIQKLTAQQQIAITKREQLKKPENLHESILNEYNQIQAKIDTNRIIFYGRVHSDTMNWIVRAYEWCFNQQNSNPEIAAKMPLLNELMRNFICVDMNNRTGMGIFNEYRKLSMEKKAVIPLQPGMTT